MRDLTTEADLDAVLLDMAGKEAPGAKHLALEDAQNEDEEQDSQNEVQEQDPENEAGEQDPQNEVDDQDPQIEDEEEAEDDDVAEPLRPAPVVPRSRSRRLQGVSVSSYPQQKEACIDSQLRP